LTVKFYVMQRVRIGSPDDEVCGTDAMTADDCRYGNAPCCPICGEFIGMKEWLPPFRVELEQWGSQFGDVVPMTPPDLLVSERFRTLWPKSRLRGLIGFESVEVKRIANNLAQVASRPTYFRARVETSSTAVDQIASQFEWDDPPACAECRQGGNIKRWKRLIVDVSTWDDADIIIARGLPGTFLTTERFKEWCEENVVWNITFVPSEACAKDYCPWEREV